MNYDKNTIEFVPKPTRWDFQDITDKTFGRLTILGYAGDYKWWAECACGVICKVGGGHVRSGATRSCGCLYKESRTTHGEAVHGKRSPEYIAYQCAKNRCNDPGARHYHRYGGRGIEFRFADYDAFLAEVGRKPTPAHTLNRIDNNGHYEAGNVEWADKHKQSRNRVSNRTITLDGVTMCFADWADSLGISRSIVRQRYANGYCPACCLSTQKFQGCLHRLTGPPVLSSEPYKPNPK